MDTWYNFYWNIVDDNQLGVAGKAVNRFVRRFVKRHLDKVLPTYFMQNPVECGVNRTQQRQRRLVCSMTSFPARIDEVWVSVETLFRQTVKADEIILWLSKDQFAGRELPASIRRCEEKGLTIRWVEGDIRSHKKYYYVLQEYKDADVVLVDDDLYYPDGLLENLAAMAARHPGAICATRVHRMAYSDESLNLYAKWVHNFNPRKEGCSKDYFFTSGAGTLIPTGLMPEETFNKEVFQEICFFADDVWLNEMARLAGVDIFTNDKYDKDEISIGGSQQVKLVKTNVLSGGNDTQIEAVRKYFNIQ